MTPETILIPSGDVELAATLTPSAPSRTLPQRPSALILAGSGPLDRDGSMAKMPLATSRELASHLNGLGWATLRFDKRGVGESGGDYLSTGFFGELADATAAFRWLRARPESGPIVVVGHSVGTWMALEIAVREGDVDGLILLSTTAKTGEETVTWQTRQIGDHLLPRPINALLRLFGTNVIQQQRKAMTKIKSTTTDVARIQLAKMNAKWMREFLDYDPESVLSRARLPTLAITGSKDVQVDPADLVLVAELAADADVFEIPDVDHILRHEPKPFSSPRQYGKQLAKPIDPRVVDRITSWLTHRFATSSAA